MGFPDLGRIEPEIKVVDTNYELSLSVDGAYGFASMFSMMKGFPSWTSALVACTLILSSCKPVDEGSFIEVESRDYVAAKQKMREGDVEGALDSYLKVIDTYTYAPESHLEAGVIYLRNEDEPILAIYHFHRYLEQKPNSREAPLVEELILSAKKQFAASLPGNPFKDAVSRMDLMETIAGLKKKMEALNQENIDLKKQNQSLQQRLTGTQDTMREILTSTPVPEESENGSQGEVRSQPLVVDARSERQVQQMLPSSNQTPSTPETYQVKAGDSLYAISMHFYGDAEHIQSIFQANRNILRSVDDLKPGQVLKLPK